MDGEFIFNGSKVFYKITDNKEPIKVVKNEEKMSRYINFYNCNNINLGTKAIYGSVDEMTNITSNYAKKIFIDYIKCK